jgi:hypothetical protein
MKDNFVNGEESPLADRCKFDSSAAGGGTENAAANVFPALFGDRS